MTKLAWDQTGERRYETGVDHGVLYLPNVSGVYDSGVAWNGLTTVTESPSGAESNPQYADNIKYLNLLSVEEFGGTIEAFTYPDEFGVCDGTATPQAGLTVGQQPRKNFGLCYRTKVGNDLNSSAGYKLHLVYDALAAPSEKAYATVNDSPEAMGFSWEFTTTPVYVGTVGGTPYDSSATMVVDSTQVDADSLADLEDALYGTEGSAPRLPTPSEVIAFFSGTVTVATPAVPTYVSSTDIVTIPGTTGVIYSIAGTDVVAGPFGPITGNILVKARPASGYKFPDPTATEWLITFV